MSESVNVSDHNQPQKFDLQFGDEIELEEAGFSFRPITGFELEIDGSVYMYSEDGNLEINLTGGELQDNISIAELNNKLAAEILKKVDNYQLIESGTETIQGTTGFLNEIKLSNAQEESVGKALICSPYRNQFFFILVITAADYWQTLGQPVFDALKTQINFYPQFEAEFTADEFDHHQDLTTESFENLDPEEEFLLNIEKGDVSLLLAARSYSPDDVVTITEIVAPGEKQLYIYDPASESFSSTICMQPLMGSHGEVCFYFPRTNQQSLFPGEYRFSFATAMGRGLQEVQAIIRTDRALNLQAMDLNFWVALENSPFDKQEYMDLFKSEILQSLKNRLAPLNLAPGKIEFLFPAPDEISPFTSINLDTDLADCSYMISESVNNNRALNIGLVDQITQGDPPEPADVSAISCGSPGMILTTASPHACVVIQWQAYEGNIEKLAEEIIRQLIIYSGIDMQDIQQNEDTKLTLNHEIGWRLRRHPIFHEAD